MNEPAGKPYAGNSALSRIPKSARFGAGIALLLALGAGVGRALPGGAGAKRSEEAAATTRTMALPELTASEIEAAIEEARQWRILKDTAQPIGRRRAALIYLFPSERERSDFLRELLKSKDEQLRLLGHALRDARSR